MDGVTTSEERGAEKQMDDYLKSLGLHRKKIAKDGSCLFRAVAEQVLHCQSLHAEVRAKCVDFLKQNRSTYEAFIEGDFVDYLCKLQDPQQWVGEVEIHALAIMYQRDFQIFQDPGKPAVNITDHNFKDKVRLCFLNGNHYDSVYPVSHVKNAALCQSILYELLYDDVFKVERGALSVCQRVGRPHDLLIDDNMAACGSSDESDNGDPLWIENGTNTTAPRHNNRGRGRGRLLSERVRRSLNPTLFRNIEYDVWHKTKRAQQKLDYCIAAGMQFTAGDRCQVRLEGSGRNYNATVKEVPADNGLVTVFIEELGKKQVPLWSLRPPSDENSWSTVVNRDKRLSNGQGDWEERSKGRGRGKNVPASSSVPAPAPGPSGRVQKQHSWPPQTTVEEQGATKSTRKSVSVVESAFGLTEEQRLAKEEEKMNVALVEIQLRDEQSFPALGGGSQGDGGRKKGGEKKKSQRNKTKSPVEDVRAPSPSAGERPKSSTPPLTTPASSSANTPTNPISTKPPPAAPAAPSADSDSAPTSLSSHKASAPKTNPPTVAPAPPDAPSSSSTSPPLPPPAVPSSASLFSFITPILPPASSPSPSSQPPSSSPSSQPPNSSPSPPPSSSLPPPTFIAPIAPSPAAAQSFLHPSSLTRSSPPLTALPHSPSPPPLSSSSSSSSLLRQAAQVDEAPPAPTPSSLPNPGGAQTPQNQSPPQVPLPQNQTLMTTSCPSHLQHPPQSQPEVTQVPQTPLQQTQYLPQSQPDEVQSQSSYPLPSQASDPVSHPPPHLQLPHPSLSLSSSLSHPSMQPQTQTEAAPPPPPPPAQPLPESPPHPQQSHPPHPSQSHLAHPPHLTSIQGAVPLQQLSQLYQDPLYPGFPQGEKGQPAQPPLMSCSRSGDDLPQDVNILRFFFNLGLKAYSMPMLPPYVYLLPLQQTHTMHPRITSRSPSPHYPPSNPPPRPQEPYPHPQYPPTSASMPPQYDHQAPPTEPPHHSDPSYNQSGYPMSQPPTHRMPQQWLQQQMPPPRNPNFPVGYPTPNPHYAVPPTISQVYHPGQSPGHPLYPSSVSSYPPSSLGYQPSSAPEELQVNQGAMEQHRPSNGNIMPGQRPVQGHGLLGSPPAANMANANNITVMVPGFAHKKEQGERVTRAVMLGELPVNNPMLASNPGDVPVSMTTMKPSSTPGHPVPYEFFSATATPTNNNNNSSPSYGYRNYPKPLNPTNNAYVPLGAPEHGQVDYLANVTMAEGSSVGCSTEDDWDEQAGFKQMNYRGPRRYQRGGGGGRGRGSHDPGRGANRRRYGPDGGAGFGYVQFNSSHRGRGRERGY
ncbi:OTU domain-containing protein 4 [Labrus mixtus]|uniref:OTU domain-containing protein 4 n=1 Tax=Labrus mixtus TaxID=508554 RepID=UPI0029C05CFE|nr:OTU domain-containing protein 4 [Labrus mixtus]